MSKLVVMIIGYRGRTPGSRRVPANIKPGQLRFPKACDMGFGRFYRWRSIGFINPVRMRNARESRPGFGVRFLSLLHALTNPEVRLDNDGRLKATEQDVARLYGHRF